MQELVDNGADVNCVCAFGLHALALAVISQNPGASECIRLIMKNDPNSFFRTVAWPSDLVEDSIDFSLPDLFDVLRLNNFAKEGQVSATSTLRACCCANKLLASVSIYLPIYPSISLVLALVLTLALAPALMHPCTTESVAAAIGPVAEVYAKMDAYNQATALSLAAAYGRVENCRTLLDLAADLGDNPRIKVDSARRAKRAGTGFVSISFESMESIMSISTKLAEASGHEHCKRLIEEASKARAAKSIAK